MQSAVNAFKQSYTRCLRTHGVPNMPDPSCDGVFNLGGTAVNPRSPRFEKARHDCQSERQAQISINDRRVSS
jgi:hypothetical protein